MAEQQINRITNAAIYLDGNDYIGQAEEVDLGSINAVMVEFSGLGLIGAMELPAGLDKIEGKIVWNSLYEDAAKAVAAPFKTVALQCRSNVETYNNQGRAAQAKLVTQLTVTFKGYQLGSYKAREPAKYESPFSATRVIQKIDGREILRVDYMNSIYQVNGEDQLEAYNVNIGRR